jgi:hypothetical protein
MEHNISGQTVITQDHIVAVANALAEAAGISPDQAMKVLDILHVGKLNENVVAIQHIMSDELATNALGLSREEAETRLAVASPDAFTLDNLRLAVKPTGLAGIMV